MHGSAPRWVATSTGSRPSEGAPSRATTTSIAGRSTTSRASGARSGTSSRWRRRRRTSVCSPRTRCRAPSGSRAPSWTTRSTRWAGTKTWTPSPSSPARRRAIPSSWPSASCGTRSPGRARGCNGSVSAAETASSRTCRTSRRRSSRS